jgi:plasmid stabilization system protein ParE
MLKHLVWSPSAESDFANILEYLNENWDEIVANHFINLTEEILEQISINPRQFPVISKRKNQKMCPDKTQFLVYRDSKSQIEILRIYDTRQDPDKLTFK